MLERPGRNKAYFNTGGMVKIRFIPPRPNSELSAFFRPGQSIVNFFVSGGQSTPITLFYALDFSGGWSEILAKNGLFVNKSVGYCCRRLKILEVFFSF